MKITIFGYSGKIGSYLVQKLLKTNHDIFIVTRNKNKINKTSNLIYCDLNNKKINIDKKIFDSDIIINLIGEYQNKLKMYETNVNLLKNLINQINASKMKKNIHFVQLSSCSVYGYDFNPRKIDELDQLKPNNLYGKTKLLAEKIIIKNHNKFFSYTIIRPSGVIDDNNKKSSFLKLMNLATKRFVILFGKKDAIGNFVHVDDLVELIIAVSLNSIARNKIYNISNNFFYNEIFNNIDSNLSYKPKRLYFYSKIFLSFFLKLREILSNYISLPDIRFLLYKTEYDSSLIKKELNFNFKKDINIFILNNLSNK